MKKRKKPSLSHPETAPPRSDPAQRAIAVSQPPRKETAAQIIDVTTNGDLGTNRNGCDGPESIADAACNEIRQRHRALQEVGRRSLEEAIELGHLLSAAKERLAYGKWYPFLAEAGIEARVAQNYLRLYHHREEVRSKSELNSHLTIAASLSALRSPRPKRGLLESAGETNVGETLTIPQGTPNSLIGGRVGVDIPDPCTIPGEAFEQREGQGNHVATASLVLGNDTAKLDEVKAYPEIPVGDDVAKSGSKAMMPVEGVPHVDIPLREHIHLGINLDDSSLPDNSTANALEPGHPIDESKPRNTVIDNPARWNNGIIGWERVEERLAKANELHPSNRYTDDERQVFTACFAELARAVNRLADETCAMQGVRQQVATDSALALAKFISTLPVVTV